MAPIDLVPTLQIVLRQQRGTWKTPEHLWDTITECDPDLADRVRAKVGTYKDPARNNEVWFVSQALYHLDKLDGFRMETTANVPAMRGFGERSAYWLIARAE